MLQTTQQTSKSSPNPNLDSSKKNFLSEDLRRSIRVIGGKGFDEIDVQSIQMSNPGYNGRRV